MKNPLVSLIIVNWNGERYLSACLKSLQKISYKHVEIIVVDQSSTDGSGKMVEKKFPFVHLIQNKKNTGYVGGNNLGVTRAKGKYTMILNNDIEVDKNFLEPLVNALEKDPKLGCVQPKAMNLRYKGKLDGGGSLLTNTGFLYHKGYLENAKKPEFNKEYYVYSVKGAYMFFRRDIFLTLGGLDKDFFIYFEESDFCGRMWVDGYTVKYIPKSVVFHWGGGDTGKDWQKRFALIQYRSFRNRICSYLKNLDASTLSYLLPIHLLFILGGIAYYVLTIQWQVAWSLMNAIWWNIIHLPKTLEKRKEVQKKRKKSDKEIFALVGKSTGIHYYINTFFLLGRN